jgi:hypothetical protein
LSGRRHRHEGDAPGTPANRRLHEQCYQLADEMHTHQTKARNQVTRLVDKKRELEENCAPAAQQPRQSRAQPQVGMVSLADHQRYMAKRLKEKHDAEQEKCVVKYQLAEAITRMRDLEGKVKDLPRIKRERKEGRERANSLLDETTVLRRRAQHAQEDFEAARVACDRVEGGLAKSESDCAGLRR